MERLLVINPKSRETCDLLGSKLRELRQKCDKEGPSYCLAGKPRPMTTDDQDLSGNQPFYFPRPSNKGYRMMISHPADTRVGADTTWMVDSGSTSEGQQPAEIFPGIDSMVNAHRDIPKEPAPPETNDEETPLLSPSNDRLSFVKAPVVPKRKQAGVAKSNWCCCLQ